MTDRTVLTIGGVDRVDFMQGLVTNDVARSDRPIVYAALLTPQGKFIADFFVVRQPERLLIDVATTHAPALAQRLSMYRLRADVQIDMSSIAVARGITTPMPETALPDPRHSDLGWRDYSGQIKSDATDWDALRVKHLIPETGIELTPDTYILEAGFERLNGIDFKKGCYVGQEIAARMKHKTELKKGLRRLRIEGSASVGDAITSHDRPAGVVHTVSGDTAIAYLRFDRAVDMKTEKASLHLTD